MIEKIQPIHQWNEGLINSCSGKLINLHNPTEESITLFDIAIGLNNTCRFGGQIHTHHGVDKHTLLVHHLAPNHLKKVALLHDAAEAYLGDVIKPLKEILGNSYKDIEHRFEVLIFAKYNLNLADLIELKEFDKKALELENNYFRFNDLALIKVFGDMKYPLAVYNKQLSLRLITQLLLKEFAN